MGGSLKRYASKDPASRPENQSPTHYNNSGGIDEGKAREKVRNGKKDSENRSLPNMVMADYANGWMPLGWTGIFSGPANAPSGIPPAVVAASPTWWKSNENSQYKR